VRQETVPGKPTVDAGKAPFQMHITHADFEIDAPLALPEDEVHVWRADLESIGSDESRWRKVLSPDETTRASRFHFTIDRERFVAARALLRTILAGYLAVRPGDLSFAYSKKEKPSLAPLHAAGGIEFNVSHSGGIALYAFTRGRELGIDIEQIRNDFEVEPIARRFFSAYEQQQLTDFPVPERVGAFFRCWTRKEAYIKATGDGLSLPLSQFDVSLAAQSANALLSARPDNTEAERWLLREVPAGSEYVGALCVRGRDWTLRDWSENLRP
jgi:4'-phosphopantetheinyl transferase